MQGLTGAGVARRFSPRKGSSSASGAEHARRPWQSIFLLFTAMMVLVMLPKLRPLSTPSSQARIEFLSSHGNAEPHSPPQFDSEGAACWLSFAGLVGAVALSALSSTAPATSVKFQAKSSCRAATLMLFMALLGSQSMTSSSNHVHMMTRLRAKSSASSHSSAGSAPTKSTAEPLPSSQQHQRGLRLRGGFGDNLHEQAVDVGGRSVKVYSYKEGDGITCLFESDVEGLELQWGVAMGTMDAWTHPRNAGQGVDAIVDHSALAVKTAFRHEGGKQVVRLSTNGANIAKREELLGVRFVLQDTRSGKVYPAGGMTLFTPLKEGLELGFKIKTDYGTLEQRMAKRTNLPTHLDGDGGREHHQVHEVGKPHGHAEPLQLDTQAHLEWVKGRVLAWLEHDTNVIQEGVSSFEATAEAGGALTVEVPEGSTKLQETSFECDVEGGGTEQALMVAWKSEDGKEVTVHVASAQGRVAPLWVHWSVGQDKASDWAKPADALMPPGSKRHNDAVQSELQAAGGGREVKIPLGGVSKPPLALNFVFVDPSKNRWYKAGHEDFHVPLDVPDLTQGMQGDPADVGQLSLSLMPMFEFEGRGGLSLMERFESVRSMLASAADRDKVLACYIWLRFSQVRQLSWQRKHNTKPRELSQEANRLSMMIAARWKSARGVDRQILRMMLSAVPRGSAGGDGQAIRDEILVIMRRFEIKKRKGTFMEEWHQKLHNNSTPDDIFICEAYIRFLQSDGNKEVFYGYLEEHGITRKRLLTFERPILQEPVFFPSIKNGLINEFSRYLQILKSVHSGADLVKSLEACRGFLDGHVVSQINAAAYEQASNNNDPERMLGALGHVVAGMHGVGSRLQHEGDVGKLRDLLYLDLALEAQARLFVEKALGGLREEVRPLWLALVVEALTLTMRYGVGVVGESEAHPRAEADASLERELHGLREALGDWVDLVSKHGMNTAGWSEEGGLLASSVLDRMRRGLSAMVDRYQATFQRQAEYIGAQLRKRTPDSTPESWSVALFTEEIVRGGLPFAVSMLLKGVAKSVQQIRGMPQWQVISAGPSGGARGVVVRANIAEVQHERYSVPTVLVASSVSGEEEVPEGVVAVITGDAPDVLSHIAVRARNLRVLFATCFDTQELEALAQCEGAPLKCELRGDAVHHERLPDMDALAAPAPSASPAASAPSSGAAVKEYAFSSYCLTEQEMDPRGADKRFGAKSSNLVALRALLPSFVQAPRSMVVPFGVFKKVLHAPENAEVRRRYEELLALMGDEKQAHRHLCAMREAICKLQAPPELKSALEKGLRESGVAEGSVDVAGAVAAMTRVWASVWNERALLACSREGLRMERIEMGVLVQRLVEAEYAFVLHTANPLTGDGSEMYGEVVVGQGEALVGNHPGRALGFTCKKDASAPPSLKSVPSKSQALYGHGLIFRSDSNAEDLPGFAGAGLFDSVPMVQHQQRAIGYRSERLVHDKGFQGQLMESLRALAVEVEKACGGVPQDIEGCWQGGQLYVVQTRPQVGLEGAEG